ncbi:MAG: acyl-ACP--UDP-N-acetylglucosamine O-acyltransferase [Planctomycetota bacterium]
MPKIHPSSVVSPKAIIDADVVIDAHCVIEDTVKIGAGTHIMSGSVIQNGTTIGRDNMVHPHVVLGGPPQDLGYHGEPTRLIIGDGNTIREFVTINRGTTKENGETIVGNSNFFMACSHVAHDCVIADKVIMANCVLLAGHVRVGEGATLNGAVAAHHFTTIGAYAYIGGMAKVRIDVPPYMVADGDPARPKKCNEVGLKRNGFSDEAIAALSNAFKKVFRTDKPLVEAVEDLKNIEGEEVKRLREFLENMIHGKHGRFLESLREH